MAQSYANPGGTGDRQSIINPTTTATITGPIATLIDGTQGNALFFAGGQSSREVKFDFGRARLITEAKWYQDNSTTHGAWQWQGSPDNSAWTSIGTTFTLGSPATQTITTLSGNSTSYRYYRMLQTIGTTSSSPWLREIEFNIDDTPDPPAAYTSWNPSDKTAAGTLSTFNLTFTTGSNSGVRTVARQSAFKYYWEYTLASVSGLQVLVGVANASATLSSIGGTPTNASGMYCNSGALYINGTTAPGNPNLGAPANGDVLCVALDMDNSLVWYRRNAGNWNASGTANPATATGGISVSAIISTGLYGVAASSIGVSGAVIVANFGNTPFLQTVPSGFVSGLPPTGYVPPTTAMARAWILA